MPGVKIEDIADLASVAGLPVAVAVGWVAWQGWKTAAGARRDQAEAEARRRYREMTPTLDLSIDMKWPPDTGLLVVKLAGPREVERYDRIRVEVRDDGMKRDARSGGDASEEGIRQQVWGPFRLRPGVDGADSEGRAAEQDGRAVTDEWWFTVERTNPPGWWSTGTAGWRQEYEDKRIRMRVEIGLGDQVWSEMVEVDQPPCSAFEDGDSLMV